MTSEVPVERLREVCDAELVSLAGDDPELFVLTGGPSHPSSMRSFSSRYPERSAAPGRPGPTWVAIAGGLALGGRTVFITGTAAELVGASHGAVRDSVAAPRANVKLVGTHAGLSGGRAVLARPMLEDLGMMRGIPGMTIAVPSDGPTTRAAVRALAQGEGPAYLRLTEEPLPIVSDGSFRIGEARELRAGSDLALLAVGAMVGRALTVAEELHRVGVEARVLDLASVKPFDEKSVLRAARETGALLTLEEHSVLTGIGTMVAASTAENYPVPVRRLGVPDLFGEPGEADALRDRLGLSIERALEEAWELLKTRGKVH